MSKLDSFGVGLLPIAVAAGLLSGTFFRQAPATEPTKPVVKPVEPARAEEAFHAPWLSDLRPLMEAMGDALGVPVQRDAVNRASTAIANGLEDRATSSANEEQATSIPSAIKTISDGMSRRTGSNSSACDAVDDSLADAERTLNAYLISSQDESSPSRKFRSALAEASLNQVEDWRALLSLTQRVKARPVTGAIYAVDFIVATIPDYVDSNAGWFADQNLTAIQSGMSRAGYLLDRFRLIDWSRNDARSDNPVANESRLHERQPGALIFRRVAGRYVHLEVVLLALETPTSGIHRTAFRNAMRFVRAWNRCEGSGSTKPLKVLGPTFSGSTTSMALTLAAAEDGFSGAFKEIFVVSGSATADDNPAKFRDLRAPVTFSATVQPTSEIRRVMADSLHEMNHTWDEGNHVAILTESNTAYGASGLENPSSSNTSPSDDTERSGCQASTFEQNFYTALERAFVPKGKPAAERRDPFRCASVFTFPLHISQLRNDSPAATSAVTLLPTPAVPLNMREATPPADQVPALRPPLTSSVVESTVGSILDTIRHERLTAVGIQATDDRDVLFLAREVKRAVPDVQLFLLGAHALYLHQDYIPYLRGTLVASTYSLSLTTQTEPRRVDSRTREPFQSMVAEGIFNATLWLMDKRTELIDYCVPGQPADKRCAPPVWVSVIGEDGFWPVRFEKASPKGYTLEASVLPSVAYQMRSLPMLAKIVATLLAVFVVWQVLMLVSVNLGLKKGLSASRFIEWPVLRVLAPPITYQAAMTAHRFSFVVCFVLVTLLSGWMAAVLLPFGVSRGLRFLLPMGILLAAALVLVPAMQLLKTARGAKRLPMTWPAASRKPSSWLLLPILALLVLTVITFVIYVTGIARQGDTPELSLTLARLVGGGIISPAPTTLCLFAALYAGMFAAMRRGSLVGNGYTSLEKTSPTFALFNGRTTAGAETDVEQRPRACLGDVLDMPAQNLPLSYILVVLLAMLIAILSIKNVSAIDGKAFTSFLGAASATALMLGLVNLAQGLAIWNTARAHLKWLALSPIEGAFNSIANLVPWNLSLAPPRLMELMPVARRADGIVAELRTLTGLPESEHLRESDETHRGRATDQERRVVEAKLGFRRGDLNEVGKRVNTVSKVKILEREIRHHQQAAFIQSSSWFQLWKVSDAIVEMLKANVWRRTAPDRRSKPHPASGLPVMLSVTSLPEAGHSEAALAPMMKMAPVLEGKAAPPLEPPPERAVLIRHCEEFVALQCAFVLRDIVARTVSTLFTAMLCLTFLTAAHLLYSFNGRSAVLTVDLLAVAAASLTSIWILVGMEREPVLSRLRDTTPGKLDLNWAFLQRVAVYGVLPLLAVLASLFPEIGNSLFGWLEPLRKLTSL